MIISSISGSILSSDSDVCSVVDSDVCSVVDSDVCSVVDSEGIVDIALLIASVESSRNLETSRRTIRLSLTLTIPLM